MQVRGRRLRFTAVLAIVVLALTGFSRGHGHSHGHSHHSGGGGGGCSSSHQDHDSSSSTSGGGSYDDSSGDSDDDSYGSSSTSGGSYNRRTRHPTPTPSGASSGTTLTAGTAKLISCATGKRPYATVEITNPNNRKATFQAWVTFYDADGAFLVSDTSPEVSVPAEGKATTRVPLDKSFLPAVDHCEADEEAQLRS
ncbi:hypothetical protein [Streptomyces spiralis]